MPGEDIFEGLLQEVIYCAASGHTDKWEENDWREWLRPQVEETYKKAKKLDEVEQIISDYTSSSGSIKIVDVFDAIFKLFVVSIDNQEVRT